MGYGDRAKRFSAEKEDLCLTMSDLFGEEDRGSLGETCNTFTVQGLG